MCLSATRLFRLLPTSALLLLLATAASMVSPAAAITIDFRTQPAEGPQSSFVFNAGGFAVTAVALDSGAGPDTPQVQRNGNGIGVDGRPAGDPNFIQEGESVFLDFGSLIQLNSFVLWFANDGVPDPFILRISGVIVNPLLPALKDGEFFTYSVPSNSGSTIEVVGGLFSALRVASVSFVPEPATGLLLGIGIAVLAASRRLT